MTKKLLILTICLTVNFLSAQTDSLVDNDQADLVAINTLLREAGSHLGTGYRGGGKTPAGFDCSGFVRAMYENTLGLVLPHNAKAQAAATETIDKAELQPGDLVFFNTLRKTFSHVGIYVGEGRFIHSPRTGGEVRIENLSDSYWRNRFNGARRVSADAVVTKPDLSLR